MTQTEHTTIPIKHEIARQWNATGVCGAACRCGYSVDGFDRAAKASGQIMRHVVEETRTPPKCVGMEHVAYVRAGELATGQHIDYHGRVWTVADTLPIFGDFGRAVIAIEPTTQQRQVLLYANNGAVAEVVRPTWA